MMKVKLRDFANRTEADILRWLGTRIKVEVTDDHGEVIITDTQALMQTWQGLIVHRHYDHIPYSIKEVIPSNKVEKREIVYNDDEYTTPINFFLEEIMQNMHDPNEIDHIKIMIFIWQTKLNNLLSVMSERYVLSATAECVDELMQDKGIEDIKHRVMTGEITIDDGEKEFSVYMKEAESLNFNTFALLARTGGVAVNQAYQMTIVRGACFDLNNKIFPNAVMSAYAEGIVDPADAMAEGKGAGKLQPLSSPIKIPGGWTTMGAVQVGDTITAWDGTPSKVIALHPHGVKEIYRIHFADGRYTDCGLEHLWKVFRQNWCNDVKEKEIGKEAANQLRWRVIDTEELIKLMANDKGLAAKGSCYIPLCQSEQIADVELPIDPYIMGCLLGDGNYSCESVTITKPYQQLFDNVQARLPDHLECVWHKNGTDTPKTFGIRFTEEYYRSSPDHHNLKKHLKDFGMMGTRAWEKTIPDVYLNASHGQRLALLQGLMDTDGTCGIGGRKKRPDGSYIERKTGTPSYSSSSKVLAEQVQYLVRSLGGIAKLSARIPHFTYKGERKEGRLDYRVHIRFPNPDDLFTLDHKKIRSINTQYVDTLRLRITHIEKRPDEPTQCITIDHPDHLYITDDFVVTHNSLITNGRALKDAEWFHRKTHLFMAPLDTIDYLTDCGTELTIPIKIDDREIAKACIGKYMVDEEGKLKLLTRDAIRKIKTGETINIRSVAFCKSHDPAKPCGICYGQMKTAIPYNVMMQRSANIGMYSGTTLCNPIGQRMLSTKHFLRNTITQRYTVRMLDLSVINSDGDNIFLNKGLDKPGTKVVLPKVMARELSDLRSLDSLDSVSSDKLSYFDSVIFKHQEEDPMTGGVTTVQKSVNTVVSSRSARLSNDFLEYILDQGWEQEDKNFISISLGDWNIKAPLFILPHMHEDLDVHRRKIESFLSYTSRNNAWMKREVTPQIFGETLVEFWQLVNQKFKGNNIIHTELMLYAGTAKNPEQGFYGLSNGNGTKYFASLSSCINNRGAGTLLIFERQQSVFSDYKTYLVKERQPSILEGYWQMGVS